MAFEQVDLLLPDGKQHGPIDWVTLRSWVQQNQVPPGAMLVDRATGQQQPITAFRELASAPRGDDGVATLIPYRNVPALVGYYLGVFSLLACIPFLGLVGVGMGIAAVILGIKGLGNANRNPEAKGRVHAWIAIVCGGLFALCGAVLNVLVIVAMIAGNR